MVIAFDSSRQEEKHFKRSKNIPKTNYHYSMLDCYERNLIDDYESLKENWLLTAQEIAESHLENPEEFSDTESHYSFDDEIEISEMEDKKHHHHHHHKHHNHHHHNKNEDHHRESISNDIKNSIRTMASVKTRFLSQKTDSIQSLKKEDNLVFFSQVYENDTLFGDSLFKTNKNNGEVDEHLDLNESKACNLM